MASLDWLGPLAVHGGSGPSCLHHVSRLARPVGVGGNPLGRGARRGGIQKYYQVHKEHFWEKRLETQPFVTSASFSRNAGIAALVAMYVGWNGRARSTVDHMREAKRLRETSQFFAYQKRRLKMEAQEADDMHWRREERTLFQEGSSVTQGINFSQYSSIPVQRRGGQGSEKAIESFTDLLEQFELPEELEMTIRKCGYEVPTPAQQHAIPAGLVGTDVLVSAQTGSGKTAAFLIPLIAACLKRPPAVLEEGPVCPSAVILAPTRELCQQITMEARKLCFRTRLKVLSIYGGADAVPQLKQLAEGCDIAICTPGRLSDFLERGVIAMKEVKHLVLDEADRMLDMGFAPQIRSIVQRYEMPDPGEGGRTSMMFSATFPTEIQEIAMDFMDPSYLHVEVGRVGTAVANVDQRFVDAAALDDDGKFDLLLKTLKTVNKPGKSEQPKTIIFANTKRLVDDITWRLVDARVPAGQIHGDLTQPARDRALVNLKGGRINVLVATEVAARGLDLPGIDHVINFDLPSNSDDYVHRVGRTGRIGNNGVATSFVTASEPALPDIVKSVQEADGGQSARLPDWLLEQASRSSNVGGYGYNGGGGGFRSAGGLGGRGGYERGGYGAGGYGGRGGGGGYERGGYGGAGGSSYRDSGGYFGGYQERKGSGYGGNGSFFGGGGDGYSNDRSFDERDFGKGKGKGKGKGSKGKGKGKRSSEYASPFSRQF